MDKGIAVSDELVSETALHTKALTTAEPIDPQGGNVVVDCEVGAVAVAPLTPDEVAARGAAKAAAVIRDAAEATQKILDDTDVAFIKARFPIVLAKAKAILADPVDAPAFTTAESKVISAVVVLDIAKRFR